MVQKKRYYVVLQGRRPGLYDRWFRTQNVEGAAEQERKAVVLKDPELEKTIEALPPMAQKELVDFVGYLQHKHRRELVGEVVKLGGLWADIDFDVTDEDVRALRQQVTRQLPDKV
jgi:hypothetical protein